MKLTHLNTQKKNMSAALIGITSLAISTFACSEPEDKTLDSSTLGGLFQQLVNKSSQVNRSIALNKHFKFVSQLEGTSKGNGTLKIHNLNLRLYDQHDDGVVYEGGSLKLDLKDLTGNGISELIVTGILKYTGDTETDPVSFDSFTQIFTFDCQAGLFTSLYKTEGFSIELPVEKVQAKTCIP